MLQACLVKTLIWALFSESMCTFSFCINPCRVHPLSKYTKFSEKVTFLTPWYAYVRVGNVSFSEKVADVLNGRLLFLFHFHIPFLYSLKTENLFKEFHIWNIFLKWARNCYAYRCSLFLSKLHHTLYCWI